MEFSAVLIEDMLRDMCEVLWVERVSCLPRGKEGKKDFRLQQGKHEDSGMPLKDS